MRNVFCIFLRGARSSPRGTSPSPIAMTDVTLSVTEPTRLTDKYSQAYITYKVNSNVVRGGFTNGDFVVDRRYSDFSWLVGELSAQFPGIIIPPLPDKQAVGRFSAEFVESRRRSLEKFLTRVMAHGELGQSQLMATFLQASDDTLARAKGEAKASKPKLASSAMSWFEGTVNTIANGKVELEKSAADLKVDEIIQYVTAQEKLINSVTKHVEAMVKKDAEIAHAYNDVQQGLLALGQQTEGEAIAHGFSQMAGSMEQMYMQTDKMAESETINFLEPLQEYARMLISIRTAIHQRQEKRGAYQLALVDVEAKQAAHRKVMGVSGKESQAKAKEQAVINSQEACEHSRKEFERVSERLLAEFEFFRVQKGADLKETLLSFTSSQITYHTQAHAVWADLLPKVQSIAGDHAASVLPQLPKHRPVSYASDFQEHDDDDELVGV